MSERAINKMMVIHPGSSYSTHDVYAGLVPALQRQGVEVIEYRLDTRTGMAGEILLTTWRRKKDELPRPNHADITHFASMPAIYTALYEQVDFVLVVSAMYFHPDIVLLMRRAGFPVGILFTESPFDDDRQQKIAEFATMCWTHERTSVPLLRLGNPHTFYLPHAYDPAKHHTRPFRDSPDVPKHDVVFVGTDFIERLNILGGVDWTGIDAGLYGPWRLIGSRSKLRAQHIPGVVQNEATAALYRSAKIGLNLNRTSIGYARDTPHAARAESLNPRALELAACGVFTISDHRAEVAEVFGDLVPTFSDSRELESLIRFYLAHPAERQRIARALPEAVEGWTFDERAAQLLADIERVRSERLRLVAA